MILRALAILGLTAGVMFHAGQAQAMNLLAVAGTQQIQVVIHENGAVELVKVGDKQTFQVTSVDTAASTQDIISK